MTSTYIGVKASSAATVHRSTQFGVSDAPIILRASGAQLAVARSLAIAQTRYHDGHRTPEQCRGEAGNQSADYWGLLAELLTVFDLEAEGYSVSDFTPFALQTLPPWDFILVGRRYDIKAVAPGSSWLTVNEAKRQKYTEADVQILPVRFTSPVEAMVLRPICPETAGRWDLRQGHSDYRSANADHLTPLTDWCDLLAKGGR